jgi:hypothetical protein
MITSRKQSSILNGAAGSQTQELSHHHGWEELVTRLACDANGRASRVSKQKMKERPRV